MLMAGHPRWANHCWSMAGRNHRVTEFGPMGPWEVDHKSDWGVAIEETGHEKAKRYLIAMLQR